MTSSRDVQQFGAAVRQGVALLRGSGFGVEEGRRASQFALVGAASDRDPGFDVSMFAQQLDAVRRLEPAQVARYGLDAEDLEGVKDRCIRWAARLRAGPDR